jgi:transposase
MAIHRGIKSFLTCAIERSDPQRRDAFTAVLETGEDILKHKAAYSARRRSLGRQGRQLGAGAKGHGVERRHERVTRIEDSEALWVRSKCQEVAAHLFRLAERHGVGRILVEHWTNPASNGAPELGAHVEHLVRSFPLAELRACIEWGAKKRGYSVELVRTDYNSRDCPGCGHRHEQAQAGTFMCHGCKLERGVDVIFVWNMLQRDVCTPGIEETKEANKRAASLLRKAAKRSQVKAA